MIRQRGACLQEYLKNYYAEKHQKTQKSSPCLSSSPTGGGPGHTILKKAPDQTLSSGEGDTAPEPSFGHSPSLPNRHAKFRDVVEIVEFGEREKVKTGVHFAHEEQLHDDEDEYDGVGDYDDDDQVQTRSECSSTSGDDPVLFFSQEDDDNSEKVSTTRSDSSTNGSNTPEPRLDDGIFLLDEDVENASNENVLKNIFTSLSCRNETSTPDSGERQQPTVKHVRLMDRVEPVEREADHS